MKTRDMFERNIADRHLLKANGTDQPKAVYSGPELRVYGSVSKLTKNGNGSGADGGITPGMTMGA